jgi:hypothetical protein
MILSLGFLVFQTGLALTKIERDINHLLPFCHLLCDLMFWMFYFRINSLPLSFHTVLTDSLPLLFASAE